MTSAADMERRPLARLQLRKLAVTAARSRPPVFHFFEELYARAAGAESPRGGAQIVSGAKSGCR